ncbi:achacin-like [Physella acuta]|uniref:achacin-like n=1 Tax=Physella acuta TaxID=109671 RepID=UPI0027DC8203|nr:achacin-like [Physella acuta]
MWKRVNFLLLLTAHYLDYFSHSDQNTSKIGELVCSRTVDVAIVGAGPSGSYAAYKLRYTNMAVEVFELSDRVGGRLYTATLPNAPDLLLELGGMRFIPEVHTRVDQLSRTVGLTKEPFALHHGNTVNAHYYLRGRTLTSEQVRGGDVPYDLSPEEKANQGRLFRYYLEKMTGYNGTDVTPDILEQLKLHDGRYMYTVSFDEAFDKVATAEGKAFLQALAIFQGYSAPDVSPLAMFVVGLGPYSGDYAVHTIKEGMSALPVRFIDEFLKASERNKLYLNRRLVSIENSSDVYVLHLMHTSTHNGNTFDTLERDVVCAKKVILAVPKLTLTKINWKPLRDKRVRDAINAVKEVPASKVFMTFPDPWWLQASPHAASVMFSDRGFGQAYDWGRSNVTGVYALLASYADEALTRKLFTLNEEQLTESILTDLAKAYGIRRDEIPTPLTSLSQFWASYSPGYGYVIWRTGYRYDDVISTIQRPSPADDVFIVGADHAKTHEVDWSEGAYASVDRLFSLYFN